MMMHSCGAALLTREWLCFFFTGLSAAERYLDLRTLDEPEW
jgi:hypothetical protein